MSLADQITIDLQAAMKAKEVLRLGTLRMIKAALKNQEIENRAPLDDAAALTVMQKMCKQRKDSIEQFEAGNRQDLADKEKEELKIIETYMPAQVEDSAIEAAVDEVIRSVGATGPKQMGAVMGKVMAIFKAQAVDGKRVQKVVQERLAALGG